MSGNASILMVDDERHISAMTRDFLQAKGFEVQLEHHGHDIVDILKSGHFDLCILDVTMPLKDGFTLAVEIRNAYSQLPLIFLTGRTDTSDRIKGLRLGAADYITKPYSLEELELRILNILHRQIDLSAQEEIYPIGKWMFNTVTRQLMYNDQKIVLTTVENKLLSMFCKDPERKVRKYDALQEVWGDDSGIKQHSLKVYISKLHKYFHSDPGVEIMNLHGEGYQLTIKK